MKKIIKAWAIIDGKDNYIGNGRLKNFEDNDFEFFTLLIFNSYSQADARYYLRMRKERGLKRSFKLVKVEIKINQ